MRTFFAPYSLQIYTFLRFLQTIVNTKRCRSIQLTMRHIQRKATPNNPKIPFKLFGVALLCCYSRKIYAYEWRRAFLNSAPIAL